MPHEGWSFENESKCIKVQLDGQHEALWLRLLQAATSTRLIIIGWIELSQSVIVLIKKGHQFRQWATARLKEHLV